MRPSAVFSEAVRNLAAGTTGALVLAVMLGAVCAGLAAADAQAINNLRSKAALFATSGSSTRVLAGKGQVDGAACDGLTQSDLIRSAGGLSESVPISLLAAPANPIPGFVVTPGMAAVLGVREVKPTGVWISRELADTLGAAHGQRLDTSQGELTIAGIFPWPEDGRDVRLSYAILQPTPLANKAMDECWAHVWPSTDTADHLIRSATFVKAGSTEPMTIGQLNKTHGATLDTQAEFLTRPTRFALVGCLVVGFVLGFVAVRRRRLEYSAAKHSGQRWWAQTATALLETAAWAFGGLVMANTALILALYLADGAISTEVLAIDARGPAIGLLGSALGTLAALARIREDHLFRYFKDR